MIIDVNKELNEICEILCNLDEGNERKYASLFDAIMQECIKKEDFARAIRKSLVE